MIQIIPYILWQIMELYLKTSKSIIIFFYYIISYNYNYEKII
jgi:hypothetical protein